MNTSVLLFCYQYCCAVLIFNFSEKETTFNEDIYCTTWQFLEVTQFITSINQIIIIDFLLLNSVIFIIIYLRKSKESNFAR